MRSERSHALEVRLDEERNNARAQLQISLERAAAAESRLRGMQESMFWRMTAPLRFATRQAERAISSARWAIDRAMSRKIAERHRRSEKC
jgi:hypothetical protein